MGIFLFLTIIILRISRASKQCPMQISLIKTKTDKKKEERNDKSEGTTGAGTPIIVCSEFSGAFEFALDVWRLLRIG